MEKEDLYLTAHSTPEDPALEWVRRETFLRTNHVRMLSGPIQGRFLNFMVRMTGARRILELGTFTGYATICMATALEDGGHIDTLEINDELEDVIRGALEKAGVADRVTVHFGDCLETMKSFPASQEPYDFVFIDANKREYPSYWEAVLPLVRPGGYILADNVLWDGKVFEDPVPTDPQTRGITAFNDLVRNDPRVENVILPLRDGVNIIRKKQ